MTLTDDQLNILNHVVEDGQAWANHAGKKNMLAKVEKYKQSYLDAQGDGYQTRKQREDASVIAEQERYDNVSWDIKRKREYNQLNQFEMQFDDQRDSTTTWVDAINTIKGKYPKE
jgi:hypothetical protein